MLTSSYTAIAVELAINVLLKGTLILGAAGLALYAFRDTSAAVRHAVWSLALLALLALPALQAVLPSWKVEPLFVTVKSQVESFSQGTDFAAESYDEECDCTCDCNDTGSSATTYAGGGDTGAVPSGPTDDAGSPTATTAGGDETAAYLLFLWLLGASMLLGRFAIDAFRVSALTERATRASDDDRALARRLAADLGIRRSLRLVVSDELSVPVTHGVLFPVVILPSSASGWTAERKRVVLLHELAHVRRWDYAIHVMIVIACSLYWFNPAVWLAARFSNMEQERACDDQALVGGVRSDVYATHLVEIAGSVVEPSPRGAFAMAHPFSLGTRVKSILARGLNRAPISQRQLLHVTVGAMSFALPLASVDLWGVMHDEIATGSVEMRVEQLQDELPGVRRYAAWALGELESPEAVDPLIVALDDHDADVRLISAWALGEIKEYDAIKPLSARLDDEDPLVREMAVLALGEIGSTRSIGPIMNAAQDDDALRESAYWALSQIGGQRAHDAREQLFQNRRTRGWENEQLWTGELGNSAARSIAGDVPALIEALADRDADMRTSAAEYLGELGDPRAVKTLLETLRDPDPEVRAMAVWALDEINPSHSYP
jgi:beta-lactamase regulating signal transducer with metallopeptidase domain